MKFYKIIIMKKILLPRLLVIMLFSMISLIIKSETNCNLKFNCSVKKNIESEMFNQQNEFPLFPSEEGFLIKI